MWKYKQITVTSSISRSQKRWRNVTNRYRISNWNNSKLIFKVQLFNTIFKCIWFNTQQFVPTKEDTDLAEMHFILNGEDQGICVNDIPYKTSNLWVVVDVYGTTKQVKIIQLYGISTLQSSCRETILSRVEKNSVNKLPLPSRLKEYLHNYNTSAREQWKWFTQTKKEKKRKKKNITNLNI